MQGRIQKMKCSPEMLVLFQQGTYKVIADALPVDTRVVGVALENDLFVVYVESAEFPEIHEGMPVPEHRAALITRLHDCAEYTLVKRKEGVEDEIVGVFTSRHEAQDAFVANPTYKAQANDGYEYVIIKYPASIEVSRHVSNGVWWSSE